MNDNRINLFVINQDTGIASIKKIIPGLEKITCMFLTTHYMFAHERHKFSTITGRDTIIRTFADYLTDDDMEECDNGATDSLKGRGGSGNYSRMFMDYSLYIKNRKVHEQIRDQYSVESIYHDSGLGIHERYWREAGSSGIGTTGVFSRYRYLVCALLMDLYRMAVKNRTISRIKDDGGCMFFLSNTDRIRLKKNLDLKTINVNPIKRFICEILGRNELNYESLINKNRDTCERITIATTIHEYQNFLHRLNYPLEIYVDGYHPSNYTRSYLDHYEDGVFVCRTMFDELWFKKNGKPVVNKTGYLEPEYMNVINMDSYRISAICLLLNHAGDWSALINRSDTDILVNYFVELSTHHKNIQFNIRIHPTMSKPAHEGVHSGKRILDYIDRLKLDNIRVSTSTLEDDLSSSELFISEYSNVLLDVFRIGKLGLIANLTNRRSFMKDYERIGFNYVSSEGELASCVGDMVQDPQKYIEKQNGAVVEYNKMLGEFYAQ